MRGERGRQQPRSSWDALKAIDSGNNTGRNGGEGRVNWSVECSAVREANERRKRAGQRDSCGAILRGSFDRTSLIFSLSLAQRIERGLSSPPLQSFESDFFNRTHLEATANVYTFNGTPDWNLSQSDTQPPDHPRPPKPENSRQRPRQIYSQPSCDTAHEAHQTCALRELRTEAARRGNSSGSSNTSLTSERVSDSKTPRTQP